MILLVYFLPGNSIKAVGWFSVFHLDKLIHGLLFFIWFALYFFSGIKKNWGSFFNPRLALITFLFFGAFLEIIQSKVSSGRSFDFMDIAANYSGGLAGFFFGKKLLKKN